MVKYHPSTQGLKGISLSYRSDVLANAEYGVSLSCRNFHFWVSCKGKEKTKAPTGQDEDKDGTDRNIEVVDQPC